jgi:hypothetical protein
MDKDGVEEGTLNKQKEEKATRSNLNKHLPPQLALNQHFHFL